MGKLIPFPEYESLVANLRPGMLEEIRLLCYHDRKRIARFVQEALEEALDAAKARPPRA